MENRYLYRGKRIDNGEWMEGHLITDEKDDLKYFIGYVLGTDEDGSPHDLDAVQVDPSTICQCTGLKDKNGKLIWEKDILMAYLDEDHPEDVTYAKVEWNGSGWITHENNSEDQECLDDFVMENYEVCGNTIDNPELFGVNCFQNGNS